MVRLSSIYHIWCACGTAINSHRDRYRYCGAIFHRVRQNTDIINIDTWVFPSFIYHISCIHSTTTISFRDSYCYRTIVRRENYIYTQFGMVSVSIKTRSSHYYRSEMFLTLLLEYSSLRQSQYLKNTIEQCYIPATFVYFHLFHPSQLQMPENFDGLLQMLLCLLFHILLFLPGELKICFRWTDKPLWKRNLRKLKCFCWMCEESWSLWCHGQHMP